MGSIKRAPIFVLFALILQGSSIQVSAGGSGGPSVSYTIFRALDQGTVGGANFSMPLTNPPSGGSAGSPYVPVEGSNSGDVTTLSSAWDYATVSFGANTMANNAQSVQGVIPLASSWSSGAGISVQLTWRTSATTGNALWQIQGQCVASGAVPGSFSSSVLFTASAAPGTTLQWKQTAVLTLTTSDALSGCTAGNVFLFRLFRDHQNAGDTITVTEELVMATFGVTQ